MISNALEVFLLRMEHLQSYIEGDRLIDSSLNSSIRSEGANTDVVRHALNHLRSYGDLHYAAKIMSIYGYLERYIEDVINEYVDCLEKNLDGFCYCGIPNYDKLVFAAGSKLNTNFKFNTLDSVVLIESLQKSIKEGTVRIVPDVFYSTSGNYNIQIIEDCFKRLGMNSFMKELWRWEPLNSYLKEKYQTGSFEHEKTENLYQEINDIVLRRNDIAHGKEITDRLSDAIILERMNFVTNFIKALNDKLDSYLLSLVWKRHNNKYSPSKMRPNKKVVEMENVGKIFITKGSSILVKRKSKGIERYGYAIIKDIKSEKGKQLTQVRSNGEKLRSFSIKLDTTVSDIKELCFD